jgi:transposase
MKSACAGNRLRNLRDSKTKMPVPYSVDLRWRVVWQVFILHSSYADTAKILNLSRRTVLRYAKLFQQTGEVQPMTRRHGPHQLLGDHEQLLLLRIILENPGIYLNEMMM